MQNISKIEHIRELLRADFDADRTDQDFLLHYLQVNLSELAKAIRTALTAKDWSRLAEHGLFIEGVGRNLDISDVTEAGHLFKELADKEDAENIRRVLSKFTAIVEEIGG